MINTPTLSGKPGEAQALHEKFYGMCAIEGCTSRYRLEAHHLTPWSQGGKTDLSELILLCWYHHQITVHHKGFQPYPDPTTGRIQLHKPTNHTNHTQHRPT